MLIYQLGSYLDMGWKEFNPKLESTHQISKIKENACSEVIVSVCGYS